MPADDQWERVGNDVGGYIARWNELMPQFTVEPMQVRSVLIGLFGVGECQVASGVAGGMQASAEGAQLANLQQKLHALEEKIECLRAGIDQQSWQLCAAVVNNGFRSIDSK